MTLVFTPVLWAVTRAFVTHRITTYVGDDGIRTMMSPGDLSWGWQKLFLLPQWPIVTIGVVILAIAHSLSRRSVNQPIEHELAEAF
jgi:hypothetical protein